VFRDSVSTTPMESDRPSPGSQLCEKSIDMGALRETYHQHVAELCSCTHLLYIQNEMECQTQRADTLKTFERVLGISIQALDRDKRLTLPDGLRKDGRSPFWLK